VLQRASSILGSLRTNVTFVILFTVLDVAFFLLAAGYFKLGDGQDGTTLLKAGGAFGFLTCICGWWIMLALVLGSTGMPFSVPLGDLSNFLTKKK
jgi:succinate-acetate transporter protein